MASLRSSRGYTSITVDRLRLAPASGQTQEGVLTISDSGVIGATGSVGLSNINVTGVATVNSANITTLTATSTTSINTTVTGTATINSIVGGTGTFGNLQVNGSIVAPNISGVTGTFGNLQVNGNASIVGAGAGRGTTTTDYLSLVSHDEPTIRTPLWTQGHTLKWRSELGRTIDLLGAAKQMVPGSSFNQVEYSTATLLSQAVTDINRLIDNFNSLLQVLSNKHAFITYEPDTPINIQIQTPQSVTFVVYPVGKPNLQTSVIFNLPIGTTPLSTIVRELDNIFLSNALPLSATLSGGIVTITANPGAIAYAYKMIDSSTLESAYRFLSHIGFASVYIPGNEATGSITGVDVTTLPPQPTALGAPTGLSVISKTTTSITVGIDNPTGLTGFRNANFYLGGISIGSSSSNPCQFTFPNLAQNTQYTITATLTTAYDEGPRATTISVTTEPPPVSTTLNVLTTQYATSTPSGQIDANQTYVQVLTVAPGFWPANLTNVSQINSITLQFKSEINFYGGAGPIVDARLVLLKPSVPEIVIYYAFQNRIILTPPTVQAWVGSPDPAPSTGPNYTPAGPETITDQTKLRAFFGVSGTSDTIDKTNPLLFNWFCGYEGLAINSSDVTQFLINYTYTP
jgi:hypothetical protein